MREEVAGPVGEAMAYSLSGSGKRLRPALVMAAHRELGGVGDACQLATAVEIVHTYSLVHDDLPCMDNDDLRRGRPTTHRRFDVPVAVAAGFKLVPLALRVLREGARALDLSSDTTAQIARELFEAAGARGMIKGQVLDLEAEGRDITQDELIAIHECKTGALIAASAVMGALAAGADAIRVRAIRGYGRAVGLAFQVVDDILDATATSSQLGKTAGKDAAQRKATFVSVVGLEAARRAAKEQADRGMDHLASIGLDSGLLAALGHYIVERGR